MTKIQKMINKHNALKIELKYAKNKYDLIKADIIKIEAELKKYDKFYIK